MRVCVHVLCVYVCMYVCVYVCAYVCAYNNHHHQYSMTIHEFSHACAIDKKK